MARKSRKNIETVIATEAVQTVYSAGAYTRLSSADKKKRGDSLETQKDIIENFVAAMPDIRIVGTYTDNNATGTNFDRPGFQRMLADAESGRINCIIVKDLSRFGRNAIDAGYYLEKYLPSLGVRFIAVTDSFDTNEGDGAGSPCGGILLPLKNLISESYALDISRKCKSVQRQNIRDGRFVGRMAPYGYDKDPADCHHLVADPGAAPVVRQIFAWAFEGKRAGEITRVLNDAGIMPPSRYKQAKGLIQNEKLIGTVYWKKQTVVSILTDRVYTGDMVQGKTRTVNHKELAVDPDEWVCVPGTHEAVVSREVFEQVQKLREMFSADDRAVRRAAVPFTPNVFKGKILCARCGHPMHRHRQNKDGTYWYRCESQHRYSKDACVQVSVKEADLKEEVLALLHKQAAVILGGYIRLEATNKMSQDNVGSTDTELREITRQLADSGRFLKSLYESMVEELITPEEFTSMKAGYEAKIEALSRRADMIRANQRQRSADVSEYRSLAEAVSAAVTNDELSAEIIDRLVDRIEVNPDKSFEVVLKFCDEFKEVG